MKFVWRMEATQIDFKLSLQIRRNIMDDKLFIKWLYGKVDTGHTAGIAAPPNVEEEVLTIDQLVKNRTYHQYIATSNLN